MSVASGVEVDDGQGIRLDEVPPRLDLVSHEGGEQIVRRHRILDLHPNQPSPRGIHGCLPELIGIHLAKSLVPLDVEPAARLAGQPVER